MPAARARNDTAAYARDMDKEAYDTTREAQCVIRSGVRCDTAEHALRHGRAKPATWCLVRHDTAGLTRSLSQGWVHCALDSVLTQDTVLSHCLGHCS